MMCTESRGYHEVADLLTLNGSASLGTLHIVLRYTVNPPLCVLWDSLKRKLNEEWENKWLGAQTCNANKLFSPNYSRGRSRIDHNKRARRRYL